MYESTLVQFHEMEQCLKYLSNEEPNTVAVDTSQETHEVDSNLDIVLSYEDKSIDSNLEENSDPLISLLYDNNDTSANESAVRIENGSSPEYRLHLKQKKSKPNKASQYFIKSQIEVGSKEDEFDVYGKYIATQLRLMELQTALKVQLQIQNLIEDAKAKILASED